MVQMDCPKETPLKIKSVIGVCNLLARKNKPGVAARAARFGAMLESNMKNQSVFFKFAGMAYHEKALQYEQESDSPKTVFKRGVYLGKAADQYTLAGDFEAASQEYKDAKRALQFAGAKSSQYSGKQVRDLLNFIPVDICKIRRDELEERIKTVDGIQSILLEKRGSAEGFSVEFSRSLRSRLWDFITSGLIPKNPA